MVFTPARVTASCIRRNSASEIAAGFSITRCFPAAAAVRTFAQWTCCGVQMQAMSTPSQARASSRLSKLCAPGRAALEINRAALDLLRLETATTSADGWFWNAAACCPATQPVPWISTPKRRFGGLLEDCTGHQDGSQGWRASGYGRNGENLSRPCGHDATSNKATGESSKEVLAWWWRQWHPAHPGPPATAPPLPTRPAHQPGPAGRPRPQQGRQRRRARTVRIGHVDADELRFDRGKLVHGGAFGRLGVLLHGDDLRNC